MTTDEERREVARLARALAKNEFDFECDSVAKAVGANRHFPAQAWDRLADLIDPATGYSEITPKSPVDTPKCDRDALLALADEMEGVYRAPDAARWYAMRIREYCGEVER